ncbi:MAG: hypothetical protein NTW14_06045 [bacterium]|nr:hypothetical protein [bacterium]
MLRSLAKPALLLFCLLLMVPAQANEIDGEVDISFVNPYEHFMPGFCASYRPEFLRWNRFSVGAGLALNISSRFKYETTNAQVIPDSLDWYYFDESFAELTNFDFFAEGRFILSNPDLTSKWKTWITLSGGAIINSNTRTVYETLFEQTQTGLLIDLQKYAYYYPIQYRTEGYLSPGLLIGVGDFIFGYRHWIYLDNTKIELGKPSRMVGTLRIGYRFTW